MRDLAPGSQVGRRDVAPILAGVARDPDKAVIGAGPNQVGIDRGRRERINDAAMFAFGRVLGGEIAQVGRHAGIVPREIGADDLPTVSRVSGFE